MSKPVLYVFLPSVWAKVPELALVALGYPSDAVEKKSINLVEAENLSPSFVAISNPATLPVLTVDGTSYTSTIDVTRYLVEHAPTPHKAGTHQALIDAIHADGIDPNFPFVGARCQAELEAKRAAFPGTFIKTRYAAVTKFNEDADEELKAYYATKLPTLGYLNSIYTDAPQDKVDAFVDTSVKHMQRVNEFILHTLPTCLPESGFVEGSTPGEADFHLAAWIARISLLAGAPTAAEAQGALEKELGEKLPEKVAKYIEAWAGTEAWKEVYADGLH
ncbi:hypothetical protein DACRYDRAFT_71470 [Dacryopinax primogenitus]|uniref:Uncharacterized protein n=1 Tax=Dacryopinax primogenitus (strain DJM 731) TaxID=1858805 RepID=M5FNQ6_DACPD|nr:uncharacterized protein DACRYDRAFT_71470 [Dacryopinax primogenitus]EJT97805.1 hypothetical protein DACRYDRAFT_71470 [Dacryopinax primogenitus]